MKGIHFSQEITVFRGKEAPEPGLLVGYGAIIDAYSLPVPVPAILSLISHKTRQYQSSDWQVFTPRHKPHESLYGHLVFALKYEGIDLLLFKKLFEQLAESEVIELVTKERLGQYSRRIWFLYEWLLKLELPLIDLKEGNYVPLLNEKLQYTNQVFENSGRHRIKNNLPGVAGFCPLVRKTEKLERYISANLDEKAKAVIGNIHNDILHRTSAFLLFKDSKASFSIEGENPAQNRAVRWGRAIGEAGSKPLSKEELIRLQQIVIENSRFLKMGYRTEGGFVGEHDRSTGEPIPDHISARWQDLETLMSALIDAAKQMERSNFQSVLTAAIVAFGFVFIHPFVDGNGRLHRYLIHHLLATTKFAPSGIIFPVSAAILKRMDDYRRVLESYSHPLLDFIKWQKTANNNIEVLNETPDYYRYFDATLQAEFLFECVEDTINEIIPDEIEYLKKYDAMKNWLDDRFQMPDRMVALLVRFLEQNQCSLSKRAKEKEFNALTLSEVAEIEKHFRLVFS
ncbi:MAG: Fic family protein [Pedobacter sp.]|nr:MAG: Fic family protein [Pedobacter sp.]